MATVDLEQLATALRAAGCELSISKHNTGTYLFVQSRWLVFSDGEFQVYGGKPDDKWWRELDIIRRAVSPSAPEGLRDRIAVAISSQIGLSGRDLSELTDAVLAVLPPAPRVDEKANQRVLEALQRERSIHEDNYNRAKKLEDHSWMKRYKFELDRTDSAIAVIRAMLEGTA